MCRRDVVVARLGIARVEHEFLKGWQQLCEPLAHGLAVVVYAIAIMNTNGVTRKISPFRPFPGRRHRPKLPILTTATPKFALALTWCSCSLDLLTFSLEWFVSKYATTPSIGSQLDVPLLRPRVEVLRETWPEPEANAMLSMVNERGTKEKWIQIGTREKCMRTI